MNHFGADTGPTPALAGEKDNMEVRSEIAQTSDLQVVVHPSGSKPRGRILVVDDERVNRAMLSHLLKRNGYSADEAADGEAALLKISEESFDLVLLDVVMPRMDGYTVLKELRRKFSEFELPVIMVTANNDSGQIVDAFCQGANDYVTKPIDVQVTLARIGTHIRLKHAQVALRDSEQRYALAARGTNDGLWDWNLTTNEVYYSPRWKAMLGLADEDVSRSPECWLRRIHAEDRRRVEGELASHWRGETQHFETELRVLHQDGNYRWMLCRGLAVRDSQGVAQRMAGSLTDITEGKVADALTGLPNRLLFLERLQRAMDHCDQRGGFQFAVLYLDIDNFKLINDSLGHDVGDRLLLSVARRLEDCLRSGDTMVARLGGDEFTVLLERIRSDADAHIVAERILEKLSQPVVLDDREIFASASIGITVTSDRWHKAEHLLREADTAMYHAKAEGKSRYRVFDPSMQEEVSARLELENDLRRAVERNELWLQYQPIVELKSGRLTGFEALVRWQHPRLGLVSPVNFVPIAEETGIIVPIGWWVLREACQQIIQWKEQLPAIGPLMISVNASSKQLSHPDCVQQVAQIIDETGIDPNDLKLELTESAIMDSPELGAQLLAKLRELGVRVGIDDFGTGYSSLAYLHRLPLDVLKVDRSFVSKMIDSQENAAIVRTILALAHSLDLDVVAEGIETDEQRAQLTAMGCEYGQGYLFGRPLDRCVAFELLQASLEADHLPSRATR